MYAEGSLMERSLKKPLKFKKKIQMVKSQERKWSLFVEIQRKALGKVRKLKELTMCVLLSRFRINFGTGSGLANANFFLKSGPFQETSRIEESFYCRNISKKNSNQDRQLTQEKSKVEKSQRGMTLSRIQD